MIYPSTSDCFGSGSVNGPRPGSDGLSSLTPRLARVAAHEHVNTLDDEAFAELYGAWAGRTPPDAAALMHGYPGTWWVAGGWALEAFTGVARDHEDLDFVVLRSDLPLLRRHLAGRLHVWTATAGALCPLLPEDDPDGAADDLLPAGCGQVWTRRSAADPWEYDILLNPGHADEWICKRDPEIRLPMASAVWRRHGVSYLMPEVQLLLKAKGDRAKDRADLDAALPLLDADRRRWLAAGIERMLPGHPWLARL